MVVAAGLGPSLCSSFEFQGHREASFGSLGTPHLSPTQLAYEPSYEKSTGWETWDWWMPTSSASLLPYHTHAFVLVKLSHPSWVGPSPVCPKSPCAVDNLQNHMASQILYPLDPWLDHRGSGPRWGLWDPLLKKADRCTPCPCGVYHIRGRAVTEQIIQIGRCFVEQGEGLGTLVAEILETVRNLHLEKVIGISTLKVIVWLNPERYIRNSQEE